MAKQFFSTSLAAQDSCVSPCEVLMSLCHSNSDAVVGLVEPPGLYKVMRLYSTLESLGGHGTAGGYFRQCRQPRVCKRNLAAAIWYVGYKFHIPPLHFREY